MIHFKFLSSLLSASRRSPQPPAAKQVPSLEALQAPRALAQRLRVRSTAGERPEAARLTGALRLDGEALRMRGLLQKKGRDELIPLDEVAKAFGVSMDAIKALNPVLFGRQRSVKLADVEALWVPEAPADDTCLLTLAMGAQLTPIQLSEALGMRVQDLMALNGLSDEAPLRGPLLLKAPKRLFKPYTEASDFASRYAHGGFVVDVSSTPALFIEPPAEGMFGFLGLGDGAMEKAAELFGVSVRELSGANGLEPDAKVPADRHLRIPLPLNQGKADYPPVSGHFVPFEPLEGGGLKALTRHTMLGKPYIDLGELAAQYRTTESYLMALNPHVDWHDGGAYDAEKRRISLERLYPARLNLPQAPTPNDPRLVFFIPWGETMDLATAARNLGVSLEALRQANALPGEVQALNGPRAFYAPGPRINQEACVAREARFFVWGGACEDTIAERYQRGGLVLSPAPGDPGVLLMQLPIRSKQTLAQAATELGVEVGLLERLNPGLPRTGNLPIGSQLSVPLRPAEGAEPVQAQQPAAPPVEPPPAIPADGPFVTRLRQEPQLTRLKQIALESLPSSEAAMARLSHEEFVRALIPAAIYVERVYGIPAAATVAQAALESGWGRSAPGFNLFGHKGTGSAGSTNQTTQENYGNGGYDTISDTFAAERGFFESVESHGRWFTGPELGGLDQNRYYRDAIEFLAIERDAGGRVVRFNNDASGFIECIVNDVGPRYATDDYEPEDPLTYAQKMEGLMSTIRGMGYSEL